MKLKFTIRTLFGALLLFGLALALLAHRMQTEREIRQAIQLIDSVPDNRYLGDLNTDPTSLVRTVNYLQALNERVASNALRRYAQMHPGRNNLGILANQLVDNGDANIPLSSTMRQRNGLIFVVEFPPGSELGCPKPHNMEIFELALEDVRFRKSEILLPLDPINTLREILVGVEEIDQIFAIRQLVVASGGDFHAIRDGCETPDEIIQRLTKIGFRLNPATSTYALEENAG